MAGYIIGQVDVTDAAGFEEYRKLVGPTVEQYGGSYVVRGADTETVEGDWDPKRLVIIRFDSVARAKEWYYSPEYEGPKALRHRAANTQLTFVEGA